MTPASIGRCLGVDVEERVIRHSACPIAAIVRSDVEIPALDGYPLAATTTEPADPAERRASIGIGSATAVPRGFYAAFADHLARAGAAVVSFDYRGTGGSGPASLKGSTVRMRDWGEQDIAGVIAWMAARQPDVPIGWVGSSFGGFGTGLAHNSFLINRQLSIATMSGYWGHMHGLEKHRVRLIMGSVMPAVTAIYGYMPSRLMGGTLDLPQGVVKEWSKWCMDARFLMGDPSLISQHYFKTFYGAVRFTRILDDPWSSDRGVQDMLQLFVAARDRSVWTIGDEAGGSKVGHLGFFRRENKRLWDEAARWLLTDGSTQNP